MSIPTNVIINAIRIRAYGKPFYAADLGLNGGEINGLRVNGYIRPTGNTKTIMVNIGDCLFKECEVQEWEYSADRVNSSDWLKVLEACIADAKALLEAARQFGLEEV